MDKPLCKKPAKSSETKNHPNPIEVQNAKAVHKLVTMPLHELKLLERILVVSRFHGTIQLCSCDDQSGEIYPVQLNSQRNPN
jgi:hypothetical protein